MHALLAQAIHHALQAAPLPSEASPGVPMQMHDATWSILLLPLSCMGAVFAIAVSIFWVWMLVDCLTREFKGNEKIVWVLVIIFANWVGALIYFFVGRSQGVRGA